MAKAKTAKSTSNGIVAKTKDFGKIIGTKAKEVGTAAKKHVARHKAAYIAGSAGLPVEAVGGAVAARRKKPRIKTDGCAKCLGRVYVNQSRWTR